MARDEHELEAKKRLLERNRFKILTEKTLDTPPVPISREEAFKQGFQLFNQERYWESHEVLEQIWRKSKGIERDALQSVILTAAAFVHYQKGESEICLSILKRARAKMGQSSKIGILDFDLLRAKVDKILDSGRIRLFELRTSRI